MLDQLQFVLEWVARNPDWTLALLAFACAGESIVVLGVLIPTTLLLLLTGGFVAAGALPFWPAAIAATVGAVLGDLVNFWVGRRYGERALQSSLAERYQAPIERSRLLFAQHGAKALLIGRFVGLIRPFVAAIAGACRMSPLIFIFIELIAAFVWAVPQLVIGVAFGASLDLAAEVATRLVVVILALLAFLVLLVWAIKSCIVFVQGHGQRWITALLDWSHRHRRVGRLGEWLADPSQPETPGLALLAMLLLAISALWLWLWWGVAAHHPTPFDALAYQGMKNLHTPLGLALAVGLAQLGEWPVYLPVAATVLLVLLVQKRHHAAYHWVAALGFAGVIVLGLTLLLVLPDPLNYYRGELGARFSGRELVMATVVYGFLPVLLATGASSGARITFYTVGLGLIGLIALAQVYLGAQWLSVGAFSVFIGSLWTALLALGYRRHGASALHLQRMLPAMGVFCIAAAFAWSHEFGDDLSAVTPSAQSQQDVQAWWRSGYNKLPAYRIDMAGVAKQPLNVQWLGPLGQIEAALQAAGWSRPEPPTWRNLLRWLSRAPLAQLPILPQTNAAADQALIVRKSLADDRQAVLRLWPSEWTVASQALWIGSITEQRPRSVLRLVKLPETFREYSRPMQALNPTPPGFLIRRSAAHPGRDNLHRWNGSVWLLRPAP